MRLVPSSVACRLGAIAIALVALAGAAPPELPQAKPEDVGVSADRLTRVDAAVGRAITARKIAGAVTLVARYGKVVHFAAHGQADAAAGRAMTPDALFRMASSTKPVTGVAVMMLVEEGKVRLADPVAKFVPEFKDIRVAVERDGKVELVPAARPVTVLDLLTHTSGLGSGGVGAKASPPVAGFPLAADTLETFAARLGKGPLDFQPGAKWRYSGLAGIDTLSRIVEVASGRPYDEFLKERLFGPLGMTDTAFTGFPADRLAAIHKVTDGKLEVVPSFIRLPKGYYSGAAGLTSTAADYFRFGQMLANGGELDGKRLLAPRTVARMAANHVGDTFAGQLGRPPGMGFGLTVETVVDPVKAGTLRSAGSFGWDGAFGTHFFVDPAEGLVGVLLVQAGAGANARALHGDFETAVMQALVK